MGKLRSIISNSLSMLTSDVLNRVTTFVLYALVARYLGTFAFGQLSLALMLFFTFQVFAALGLRMLIAREVARDPSKTELYLVNGSITIIGSTILSILGLFIFTQVMGYNPDTTAAILLLSLGLLPYALTNVCEAIFQAWQRMTFIAYANVPANALKVILAFILLEYGYGVSTVVIVLVLSHLVILLIEWYCMLRFIARPSAKIDLHFAYTMIRETVPFLGIDSVAAIWVSLNVLLLSALTNETDVGLYNAATQVLVPAYLVLRSLTFTIYPVMCRKFDTGLDNLKQIHEYLLEVLLAITVPAAIGIFFLAEPILLLFYGDEQFATAARVLRILAWMLIPLAFTSSFGPTLQASLNERINLRIVIVNTLISLVLGIILIQWFGIMGAAFAALTARLADMIQHYIPVTRLFSDVMVGKVIWKSALASLGMTLYLIVLTALHIQSLWLIIPSAALIYAACMVAVVVWSEGDMNNVKQRYIHVWTD
jgi:O-antigen/teichoic acid export membrane protein